MAVAAAMQIIDDKQCAPRGRWEREVPAGMLTTTTSTLDNALMLGEWIELLALFIDIYYCYCY